METFITAYRVFPPRFKNRGPNAGVGIESSLRQKPIHHPDRLLKFDIKIVINDIHHCFPN
jgi:hypothetical protein